MNTNKESESFEYLKYKVLQLNRENQRLLALLEKEREARIQDLKDILNKLPVVIYPALQSPTTPIDLGITWCGAAPTDISASPNTVDPKDGKI